MTRDQEEPQSHEERRELFIDPMNVDMDNNLTGVVIGAAIAVHRSVVSAAIELHRQLGPGLLAST
ncbi:MAG: hypothetical protein ABL921_25020 [Pirellula sp.]